MNVLDKRGVYSFVFVMFLAILSVSVVASETEAINAYFFSGDTFEVNGVTYSMTLSSGRENIYISSTDGYYIIDAGDCEEKAYLKICYNSAVFDDSKQKYKALLKVYTLSPTVTISQSASDLSLQLGDESEITVTITNTDDIDAETVYYSQEIPEGLEVESTGSGVSASGNRVTWASSVASGDDKTFSYKIKAVGTVRDPLVAEISYFNGFTTTTKYSNSLSILATASYTFTMTTNATSYFLGDPVKLTLLFQNTAGKDITLDSLRILLPDTVKVSVLDKLLEKDGSAYVFSDTLKDNETIKIDIIAQLRSVEPIELYANGTVTKDGVSEDFEKTITLDVKDRPILIRPYFVFDVTRLNDDDVVPLADGATLEGNQKGTYELYIDNPYSFDLSNVVVTITSELLNTTTDVIPTFIGTRKISAQTFETPSLSSKQKFDITYNVTYVTDFGYVYTDEIERELSVTPVKDLTVKHTLSGSKPHSGDEVTVTVTVKNGRESDLKDIVVTDTIPSVLQMKGTRSATIDISSGETATVYSYTVKAPVIREDQEYILSTDIAYKDKTQAYSLASNYTLDVSPRNPDIVLRRSVDSRDVTIGEIFEYDYEIENKEAYPVHNVTIEFPGVPYTYLVDDLDYEIPLLNPGETKSLNTIEKRVMILHDDTSQSTGKPLFFFTDDQDTTFEDDGVDVKVSTESAITTLPSLFFERKLLGVTGDMARYSMQITNFGKSAVSFTLFDTREDTMTLQPGSSYVANVSREIRNDKIPKAYLSFDVGARTYYAVSNAFDAKAELIDEPVITNTNKSAGTEKPVEVPDVPKDTAIKENTTTADELETTKVSLLQRILLFFKGIFT